VESASTNGEKLDDRLTCQLYPPFTRFGSIVAVHEIVKGTVTEAPFAGAVGVGAAGTCAAASATPTTIAKLNIDNCTIAFVMSAPPLEVEAGAQQRSFQTKIG
jgi:hypothetical protein